MHDLTSNPTDKAPAGPAGAKAGNEQRTPAERLRVLLVEDEIFIRLQAEHILTSEGYTVVGSAVSANAAVVKAGELKPDLVLMDIRLLGERDGIDAAMEIRERFSIPSLFVSAYSDAATRARAEKAHPVGFVSKPYTHESLSRALRRFTVG